MKKLLLTPLWLVQILTQTKSFTRNPVLGNPWLNRLGLHVFRIILAHGVMRFRMLLLCRGVMPEHRHSLFTNGYILIPDFFEKDVHAQLRKEIYDVKAEVRECTQGDTLTHRIMLDNSTLPAMPSTAQALEHHYLKRLLRFASGKYSPPVSYIQTIKNHYISGPPDPQKNLHSDTFHPTMKSWYFVDPVDDRNGPFTYVPGSNQLTMARLKWEYKRSIQISTDGDRYSGNGSLRISQADSEEMGLQQPRAFSVPANTLVVANTHGFHCRGNATERSTRTELWTISRNNPFNPLPGMDLKLTNDLQDHAVNWWRRYCDRKAQARGIRSSWHVIDARNTIRPD